MRQYIYKRANIGDRYGKLVVIGEREKKPVGNSRMRDFVECQCDCGNIISTRVDNLASGGSSTCGCSRIENPGSLTHGMRYTRIYEIWKHIKTRCLNENCKSYPDYGGRGITVCEEWKKDFVSFYNWATENGYTDDLQIDRIDNDGNYTPDNCQWSTPLKNGQNKRNSRWIEHNGKRLTVMGWERELGINSRTVYARLNKGWNPVDAILTPPGELPLSEEKQ